MTLGILGKKIGMTQIFDQKGNVIPVTIIKSEPCIVTQIKLENKCGYNAIQIGYEELRPNHKTLTKPRLGHFNKVNLAPFRYLKEFKISDISNYEIGQKFTVEMFKIGEFITISGLSIGKGNGGNIKKNHFVRGAMTHGSKHHRLQGSIGAGTTPGRVLPGKKMPGRLGMEQKTISGLQIISIDNEENLLVIKGSIPGKPGNLVSISMKK